MRRRPLVAAAVPTVSAALLGNAFVGRESLRWFRELRHPRPQIPLPVWFVIGGVYYLQLGAVLYRALERRDRRATRLALAVLCLNELSNVGFLGRRSTRNGLVGAVVFAVPLLALQSAVAGDRPSRSVLAPYTVWVIAYDLPWAYRLWRLNPEHRPRSRSS